MNKFGKTLFFTALAVMICGMASAQVRQIFKVLDYGTGKPIEGVNIECCGQTLTTNAKGVAVFNSKKHKYGDFMDLGKVLKENYVFLSKAWKNIKTDALTKDSVLIYMVDHKRYDTERENLFDSLCMYFYRNSGVPMFREYTNMAIIKDETDELAGQLLQLNQFEGTRDFYRKIANSVNPLNRCFIDKDVRKDCEELLLKGDIDGCVEKARNQIVDGDMSDKNLQRIAHYLAVRDANNDTTSASRYYKMLYDNGFNNLMFLYDYYNALAAEGYEQEAEQLRQTELKKSKDPLAPYYLSQNSLKTFAEKDHAEGIKQAFEDLKAAQSLPKFEAEKIAREYTAISILYLWDENQAKAEQYLDSAYNMFRKVDRNEYINTATYLRNQLFSLSFTPCFDLEASELTSKIKDYMVSTARELYQVEPTLSSKLFYLYTMQKVSSDNDSLLTVYITAIDSLQQELKNEMPYILMPNIFGKTKTTIVAMSLYSDDAPGELLKKFDDYKTAYRECNELYPSVFDMFCLRVNRALKVHGFKTDNDFIADKVDAFTEEILTAVAKRNGDDTILAKADFYNSEAERLYSEELYKQSMSSYDKAAGYYDKAAADDASGYAITELCTNRLQKGDAYYNQKRYNEAFDCYQQVFDYEKRIPEKAKAVYTARKAAAYHFQGDVFLAQQDFKKAKKYFDKSDKEFKKAEKLGDSTLYGNWAELHYSKAVSMAQQEKIDKMIESLQKAESLYETKPMTKVSQKYEKLKATLIKYYDDNDEFMQSLISQSKFYQYLDSVKLTDMDHYQAYIGEAIELGDLWSKIGVPVATLRYYKDAKEAKEFLMEYGETPDDQYYKLAYAVARYYRMSDSLEQAVEQFRQCSELNRQMYCDTAPDDCKFNELNIKSQTAQCFEKLAEQDPDNADTWNKEALKFYSAVVGELATMDTNPSLKRNRGYYHRRMGVVCYSMNRIYTANKHFDTSLAVLTPLYQNGYKEYVEEDIALNYIAKALVYKMDEDMYDIAKAKDYLLKCMEICQNASDPDDMTPVYFNATSVMVDILEDPSHPGNADELKKYRKLKADLQKKMDQ
ncbi:MAG: hypothetical protein IKQ94_09890 [Bacteroidales bacterium]|nr:hypothetical protein [Bacteroidales bacterium]